SRDSLGALLQSSPGFSGSVSNPHRPSRARARSRSNNPADAPMIQPNYPTTDEDRRVAVDSIRVARRIVAQPALKPYRPVEYLPGEAKAPNGDDAALIRAAGDIGTTIFHPVGTAKMGRASDPSAVVDERLRVFGLE